MLNCKLAYLIEAYTDFMKKRMDAKIVCYLEEIYKIVSPSFYVETCNIVEEFCF